MISQALAGQSAVLLGAVAVLLAWPVPLALGAAAWPMRAPARALLLWQAIGLAGGLSMIGALLLAGWALLPGIPVLPELPAAALAVYLLAHLARTIADVTRQRRRHLALLSLLSAPDPSRAATRILDDAAPVAYCLPRGTGTVTVLSQGLLDRLDPDELAAVIAHERAHVAQRHDILLVAFRAWRAALPWFPIAARAEQEVASLVEMLADDRARRTTSDETLARAILTVAGSGGAVSGVAAGTPPESSATPHPGPRSHDRFRRLAA